MNTQNNRHTDQRLRSMELAAVAFIATMFVLGFACGVVLRPFLVAAIA